MKRVIIDILKRTQVFNKKRLENSMIALKNGDDSQFDIIYEETHRLVFYVIYSVLKNKTDAEDVLQQVYMKVYEKIHQFTDSPKAWICSIAKNLALNFYQKKAKEKVSFVENIKDIPENNANLDTPLIDLASRILEEDEFNIVMLCVVEKYKRREVAKLFNLSTSGVTWKLHHALEKLRRELHKENEKS